MSLLENILGRLGYHKSTAIKPPPWLLDSYQLETQQIPGGETYEAQSRLYIKLTWIQTAISAVVDLAAPTPLRVKERVGERLVDIDNHPFEKLIEKPNPFFSRFDLIAHTLSDYSLTGNAYWHVIRYPDNENGEPIEIWPVPAYRIQPVPDKVMGISYYSYKPDGITELKIPAWQIIHYKKYHPLSMYVGLSPIESLAVTSIGDLAMQKWNANYFDKNNAKIPGAIAYSDMINDSDWERIKQEYKDQWGGTNRSGPMLMRGYGDAIQYIQMGMSQKDMEFLNGRQFNKEEIFSIYARGLTSVLDKNATEANAKAGKATLKDNIYAILDMMGQKITSSILSYWGDVVAKFDDVREIDRLMELREQREFSRTHTINEIRVEKYNDDPLSDERGDLFPDQITELFNDMDVDQESSAARTGATEAQINVKGYDSELRAWRKYELNRFGKKNTRKFECKKIPKSLEGAIRGQLKSAQSIEEIESIFKTEPLWMNYP
jgi:HK97 family phage portal protein